MEPSLASRGRRRPGWLTTIGISLMIPVALVLLQEELISGEVIRNGTVQVSLSQECYARCCNATHLEGEWRGARFDLNLDRPGFSDRVTAGDEEFFTLYAICEDDSRLEMTWKIRMPESFDNPNYPYVATCNLCGK